VAIESANYINGLDPSNPAASDPLADADNHLRLIKQVLKNTFPNVTGIVSASHHTLNGSVPIGGIILWSGALNTIPAGWVLCYGGTHARSDGAGNITSPNLQDRFVVGAGSGYAVGAVGGAIAQAGSTDWHGGHGHTASTDSQGNHNHGGFTGNFTLQIAHIPAHSHSTSLNVGGYTAGGPGVAYIQSGNAATGSFNTSSQGGSDPHRHSIGTDGSHAHNVTVNADGAHWHNVSVPDGRPPFYALAYIMKI